MYCRYRGCTDKEADSVSLSVPAVSVYTYDVIIKSYLNNFTFMFEFYIDDKINLEYLYVTW